MPIEYEDVDIKAAIRQMEIEGKVDIKINREIKKNQTIFERVKEWVKKILRN